MSSLTIEVKSDVMLGRTNDKALHITLIEQQKEIERLNNIINELEHDFKSYELEYLRETYQGSLADFIETELKRIQKLKGRSKE